MTSRQRSWMRVTNPRVTMEIVEIAAFKHDGLIIIDRQGGVWMTFVRPWWDLVAQLWWYLTPGSRQWIQLKTTSGRRVRVQAVKLACDHVQMG